MIQALTVVALFVLSSSVPAAVRSCGLRPWQPWITEAAARFGMPERWLAALVEVESAGCAHLNGRPTESAAGAMGLAQILPVVWDRFRLPLGLGADPQDPHDNLLVGAAYWRELFDRYGSPGAFAAYHAGPARYEAYRAGSRPLPEATIAYVERLQDLIGPEIGWLSGPTPFISKRQGARLSAGSFRFRAGDALFVRQPSSGTHPL
jgi:soluble lytic murein transglycosylase-like protein